jgi:VanZ family protein
VNRLKILTLILYVLLIFFMSTRSSLDPPGPDFQFKDKVAHAAEYFVLGLLLFGGIGWTVTRSKLVTFLFLFAVGVSIAALDELLQSYVPGRDMDFYDWVADAAGVAAGVGLCVTAGFGARRRGADAGDERSAASVEEQS